MWHILLLVQMSQDSHYQAMLTAQGGCLPGVKRENKTETTGSFAYNFSVQKKTGRTGFFRLTAQPYRARSSQCGRLYI